MSYKLNKTDGSLLVDLVDGQLDTTTSDISLIGKNYTGFGEALNENLIKMLENFSKASAPSNPLIGQLWYDTTTQRVKVYDGVGFRTSGAPAVDSQQPTSLVAGDLWIDSLNNQLHFYDGTDLELAGPVYTKAQGKSGFEVATLIDTFNNSQVVMKYFVAGTIVGVWSNSEFTPAIGFTISGITGAIKKGFTPVSIDDFRYRGIADHANALRTTAGVAKSAEKFLPADSSATTTGTLTVQNSGGLTIGLAQNNILKVVGTSFVSENQLSNHDWKVRVRKPTGFIDALVVDTSEEHFGVFKSDPQYALHVGGDAKIDGDLLVAGANISVETANLRVEDKNIELAVTSDSTVLDNAGVDGGGIILKANEGGLNVDKEWVWKNGTPGEQAWTSSENIDLAPNKSYLIDNKKILEHNGTLGKMTNIQEASSLTKIGTLEILTVQDMIFEGATITTSTPLTLKSSGDIVIDSTKITGVSNPTANQDVATKYYVDDQINSEPVIMPIDNTNLTNPQIAAIIQQIYPAVNKKTGTYAYVPTFTTSGGTVSGIDIDTVKNISYISVDSNGVQNEPVVQDIAFTDASGTMTPNVVRGLKRFIVQSGPPPTWVWDVDL